MLGIFLQKIEKRQPRQCLVVMVEVDAGVCSGGKLIRLRLLTHNLELQRRNPAVYLIDSTSDLEIAGSTLGHVHGMLAEKAIQVLLDWTRQCAGKHAQFVCACSNIA